MGVLKIKQKLVYELYEYSKLKIMIKKKMEHAFGQNPFANKNNTLNNSTLQETVYRNDSVLFSLH